VRKKINGMLAARAFSIFGAVVLLAAAPYAGSQTASSARAAGVSPSKMLDHDDVEAFLDGVIRPAMAQDHITGVEVAVVKDGQLVLAKGYGYADLQKKVPTDPASTLFRVGSVSKLFVTTAAMQLVEQGRLDLDRDVNDYLDFRVQPKFGRAITMRNLLTHTAGFEDESKDTYTFDSRRVQPLGRLLASHLPHRAYPPGAVVAYSNYGMTLAGYVVQRISGKPFDQYVAENIFTPLGMTRSTFIQPPPPRPDTTIARAYAAGSAAPSPFEYVAIAPAGALSTTAQDMSRFLKANLQGGQVDGRAILTPATMARMQTIQIPGAGGVGGMALGFDEVRLNGRRVLIHGGATLQFLAYFAVAPREGFGFFIVESSGKDRTFEPRVLQGLMDRYYPREDPSSIPAAMQPGFAHEHVAGAYRSNRRADATILRLLSIVREKTVKSYPDGSITVSGLDTSAGRPKHWVNVRPLVYRDPQGDEMLEFRTNGSGRISKLIGADIGVSEFDRAGWWENRNVNLALFGFSVLVCLIHLISAAVCRLRRPSAEFAQGEPKMGALVVVGCAVNVIVLAAWPAALVGGLFHLELMSSAMDWVVRLLQAVALADLLLLAMMLYRAVRLWTLSRVSARARLWSAVIAVAALTSGALILNWNVLTLSLNY